MQPKLSLTEGSFPCALPAFVPPILLGNVFTFFGMSVVLFGVIRATGAVMPPLFIVILSLWCLRVPFAYSRVHRRQARAIGRSFPLGSLILPSLATGYYCFDGWRSIRMGVACVRAPTPGV